MDETDRSAGTDASAGDIEPLGSNRAGREQVLVTGVGLRLPMGLSFEDWERAGRKLSGIIDSSAWWLGDWLVFGKKNYSDRYQLAIRGAGLRYQTLRNYAWVARRFELGRRRSKLSFQHHAEVASLPVETQDWLLDQAEREMWTTKQLRNAIRDGRGTDSDEQVLEAAVSSRIEVPHSRVGVWRKAADCAGIEFDRWVQAMLDRAAEEVLSDEVAVGS
jgi:hypothetical protein